MNKTWLLSAVLFAGCGVDQVGDDPPDQSFLGGGGKEDAFGIQDGSPEAKGVLELVNAADSAELEETGISQNAQTQIRLHRDGSDQTRFTADDNVFDNLEELDAVEYVGVGAFNHLLAYAHAHGYVPDVDPFDPASCAGPDVTVAQLQALTHNGTVQLPFGSTYEKTRSCNGALGCAEWSDWARLGLTSDSVVQYYVTPSSIELAPTFRHVDYIRPNNVPGYQDVVMYRWSLSVKVSPFSIGEPDGTYTADSGGWSDGQHTLSEMDLQFTDHCLRLTGHVTAVNTQDTERQVVFLAYF